MWKGGGEGFQTGQGKGEGVTSGKLEPPTDMGGCMQGDFDTSQWQSKVPTYRGNWVGT